MQKLLGATAAVVAASLFSPTALSAPPRSNEMSAVA